MSLSLALLTVEELILFPDIKMLRTRITEGALIKAIFPVPKLKSPAF
jgi:hypothetical protein